MLQCAVRFKLFIHNYYKVLGIWFSTCFLATNFCWSILIYFRVMYIYCRCYKSASDALRCSEVPWIYYVSLRGNKYIVVSGEAQMRAPVCMQGWAKWKFKASCFMALKQRQLSFRKYKLSNCRRSIENSFITSVVFSFFYVAVS